MYKYIVTWILSTNVSINCPYENTVGEFGKSSIITCSVYHFTTVKESKTKKFIYKDSAFAFYERAKKQIKDYEFYRLEGISDVRIDSIKIRKN